MTKSKKEKEIQEQHILKLTTFENFEMIKDSFLTIIARELVYNNKRTDTNKEIIEELKDLLGDDLTDPNLLDSEQLEILGFHNDDKDGFYLVPLWTYQFLPDEFEYYNYKQKTVKQYLKKDIKLDDRFGFLPIYIYKG